MKILKLKDLNQDIFIRYLIKKDIIRKGLKHYKESEEEIKEFQAMLRRLLNSQKETNEN